MQTNPEFVSVPVRYERGPYPGFVTMDFRYDWVFPENGEPEKVFIVNPDRSLFEESTISDIGGQFRPRDEKTGKPAELELKLGQFVKLVR